MSHDLIKVLLIEDNPGDARLIVEYLAEVNQADFEVIHFDRLDLGLAHYDEGGFDVVLLDLSLPDAHGAETIDRATSHLIETPIILLTGLDDESMAVEAVTKGAEDYLIKNEIDPDLLYRAIRYSIERKRSKEALRLAHDGLELKVEARTRELTESNMALSREIDERKRIEEELRESREIYVQMFEDNLTVKLIFDPENGRIIDANPAACRFYGYSRDKLKTLSLQDIDLAREEQQTHELKMAARGEQSLYITRHQLAFGDIRDVELHFGPLDSAGRRLVYTILFDITERRRAEAEQGRLQNDLEKAALEWRLTFDALISPVIILDFHARVRKVNSAGRNLVGLPYDELLLRRLDEIGGGQPWKAAAEVARDIINSPGNRTEQIRDNEKDQTWEISATTFNDPSGGGSRIILVARDITQLIQLQETLRRKETEAAMGALVAGVAHEVRNPLFSISATLDAFLARYGEVEKYERYTTILLNEVNRLNRLMQGLLDYGKPPSENFELGAIEDVITNAVRSCEALAEKYQIKISVENPPQLPQVMFDGGRLLQVFQNLLDNSIKCSPPGSEVSIKSVVKKTGERIEFHSMVIDQGSGIKEEDRKNIFKPFFTRRQNGTGLGLSIVGRIVEDHNGSISSAPNPKGGTIMKVILPASDSDLPE